MKTLAKWIGRLSRDREPEYNSGVPVEPPGGVRPLSMEEIIRMHVRNAISTEAVAEGMESFEDADDFEEEDPDVLPLTHHQVVAMTDQEIRGVAASYGVEIQADLETTPQMEARTIPASGSPGGLNGEHSAQTASAGRSPPT
ncbi:MAG: hypothetical protein [Microvirus sp.]|nr:MAG: hypothetical protein [Microvirus sp.]